MNFVLIVIPFISAFAGWLLHRITSRYFIIQFARKDFLISILSKFDIKRLFSTDEITKKISSGGNLDKIMPVIDNHIDHFLNVKLKESMPVVGMFIGEKTIAQLKKVFLDELEILFPQVMESYTANISNEIDLQQIITDKIQLLPDEKIKFFVKQSFSKQLQNIEILGAVSGFVTGTIAVVITFFVL